jgi:hypothetical protein
VEGGHGTDVTTCHCSDREQSRLVRAYVQLGDGHFSLGLTGNIVCATYSIFREYACAPPFTSLPSLGTNISVAFYTACRLVTFRGAGESGDQQDALRDV